MLLRRCLASAAAPSSVIIGGSALDVIARQAGGLGVEKAVGHVGLHAGGVGRNISDGIGRLGRVRPLLVSVVGRDAAVDVIGDTPNTRRRRPHGQMRTCVYLCAVP